MKRCIKILFPIILVMIIAFLSWFNFTKIFLMNEKVPKKGSIEKTKETMNFPALEVTKEIQPILGENVKKSDETLKIKVEEEKKLAEEAAEKNKQAIESNETSKIMTLNTKANNVASTYSNTTRLEYGTSYQGRPLEAYLIKGNGSNSKTIFMEFEVHGFEDEYSKDGKVLVNLGNNIVEYYATNPDNLGDYQMIVVPSANPDGVIEGVNNTRVGNGYCFGRCTAAGIDMNRDFKSGCFQAQESQALKSLMNQYPMNIHLDFHGWENSVIGDTTIVNTFLTECGLSYNKAGRWGSGQGYVIEYTKNAFGAHSSIIEFRNSSSVNAVQVESAINKIMQQL